MADKEWTEKNKDFEWFYSRLTTECHGKHFDPTPAIAGYIDNQIVTPIMLRNMDIAHYNHLKAKRQSRAIPKTAPGLLPKKLLANQQTCPGTVIMDRCGDMTITQTLRGSDVVRVVAKWNQ